MTGAEVYWVRIKGAGKVGIVLRPRGGDWLEDETESWRRSGIDTVVSLLEPEEVAEFGLQTEEASCRERGIRFLSFPLPDRGVPLARKAVSALAADLAGEVVNGRSVAVHCRQGIGRSALMVALVLTHLGQEPVRALQAVQAARGRPVPDTEEQRAWVMAAGAHGEVPVARVRESDEEY